MSDTVSGSSFTALTSVAADPASTDFGCKPEIRIDDAGRIAIGLSGGALGTVPPASDGWDELVIVDGGRTLVYELAAIEGFHHTDMAFDAAGRLYLSASTEPMAISGVEVTVPEGEARTTVGLRMSDDGTIDWVRQLDIAPSGTHRIRPNADGTSVVVAAAVSAIVGFGGPTRRFVAAGNVAFAKLAIAWRRIARGRDEASWRHRALA